jgi:hypothetical protein
LVRSRVAALAISILACALVLWPPRAARSDDAAIAHVFAINQVIRAQSLIAQTTL